VDSALAKYRDKQDYTNHLLAAFTVGAIFKSTGLLKLAKLTLLSWIQKVNDYGKCPDDGCLVVRHGGRLVFRKRL
jgi:hypothetical protein